MDVSLSHVSAVCQTSSLPHGISRWRIHGVLQVWRKVLPEARRELLGETTPISTTEAGFTQVKSSLFQRHFHPSFKQYLRRPSWFLQKTRRSEGIQEEGNDFCFSPEDETETSLLHLQVRRTWTGRSAATLHQCCVGGCRFMNFRLCY